MTKPKLLANLPVEDLNSDNDYLGIIDKADLIQEFLKGNKDQFDKIKMFSLYGDWGSGKSTLMKYLQNNLDKEFNTFFFEAWEFEKDENLAMSLLEYITSKHIDIGEELCNNLLKYGGRVLRGLGKSIKINMPLFAGGPKLDINPAAFIDEITKNEEPSFYKALENFKTEFVKFEDEITGGDKKYNIIFIDDLDRCEPEQVLNLLSAIKLFFTYGQKTIFFCGIDKMAVEVAVKTKYGEIIKANEYLEKIFDISFSMPQHEDLLKLINHYFDKREIPSIKTSLNKGIEDFFKFIEFNNPRRLKKVLNRYLILSDYKIILKDKEKYTNSIPNIIVGQEGCFFETILTLYILVIYEFEKDLYALFNNLDSKKRLIKKSILHKFGTTALGDTMREEIERSRNAISPNGLYEKAFNQIKGDHILYQSQRDGIREQNLNTMRKKFCIQFINPDGIDFNDYPLESFARFHDNYPSKIPRIDYLFVVYLLKYFDEFMKEDLSSFSLFDFKRMIDRLL